MKTSKIAIVTGGSRGLGKDMVLSIASKGLGVILTYNSQKAEADSVVKEIEKLGQKAVALQLNVTNIKSFDNFAKQVRDVLVGQFKTDKFNYLVNNAGTGIHAGFLATTEEQFDDMVTIHQKAPFFLTQKLLALMEDGGGIVNISSGLARFTSPGYAAYASNKGAIEVLTRYQAKELGARGIRANTVAPGAIETDFAGGVIRDNPDANKYIASVTALGRAGKPDDIGSVVAFLCTDDAKWVNAQRIEVSGGMNV